MPTKAPATPHAAAMSATTEKGSEAPEKGSVATGSTTLPRPEREVEPEGPEPFDCPLDYRLWAVTFADGVTRLFDSATGTFTD